MVKPFFDMLKTMLDTGVGTVYTFCRLPVIKVLMEKLIRMVAWVSKADKAKVRKAAKKGSASAVIRKLIRENL